MAPPLNVALLQIAAHGRDRRANLVAGLAAGREAAAMGADIALFPEMWSIGYDLIEGEPAADLQRHAIDRDDPFLAAFAELAAELNMAIAITFLQRWPDGPRNTVVVYDRHGVAALEYAKVHTCDWDLECALTPGDEFTVCEIDTATGPVHVGAMICFDAFFPESARVLMLEGAELILVPNASDFEPWRMGVLQTRAIENMVSIAMTNYPGPDTQGHSCAYDPVAFRTVGDVEGHPGRPHGREGRAGGGHLTSHAPIWGDCAPSARMRRRATPIASRHVRGARALARARRRPQDARQGRGQSPDVALSYERLGSGRGPGKARRWQGGH